MKKVADKSCRENQNTHFTFSTGFFKDHAVYDIMWKITVQPGGRQMTAWRMLITFWITEATNTH